MGGLVFRGDGRFPEKMAFYGAPLKELTLARETDTALALLRTHIERAPRKLIAYAAEHGAPSVD